MRWDAIDRRYEDDSGQPLSRQQIHAELEAYIESEQKAIEKEAQTLLQAQVDPNLDEAQKSLLIAGFFAYMAQKIRDWHSIAGVIAYGGGDQMNPERWSRIGKKIDAELTYLQGFEEAIRNSRTATDLIVNHVAKNL